MINNQAKGQAKIGCMSIKNSQVKELFLLWIRLEKQYKHVRFLHTIFTVV